MVKVVSQSNYDPAGNRETVYTIFASLDELNDETIEAYKMSVGTLAITEDEDMWELCQKKGKKYWKKLG